MQNIGDQNIERLISASYNPELPDPAFVARVEARLQAAANRAPAPMPPAEVERLRKIRRRLGWGMAFAACAAAVVLILHAMARPPRQPINRQQGENEIVNQPNAINGVSVSNNESYGLKPRPRPAAPAEPKITVGAELKTKAGERRRVTLADGSVLYLNADTQLTYAADRHIKLHKGEIYTEVAPLSPLRGEGPGVRGPTFLVTAPHREVRALGTHFSVWSDGAQTGVAVTQGKVEITGLEGLVHAGQQLSPNGKTPEPALRASHQLDWTQELMAAAETPLVPRSQHAGGSLVAVDPSGQETRLTMRKYHVDVHIEDGFARTTIDQTYFNETWGRLEGTFYFPLPPDASLSRLAMYVKDGDKCKLMEGGMAERDHARNVYETILHTRRDPALLEWVDGSTFKMRVFPLEPREEKRLILSYVQKLPTLYGNVKYRFPAGHSLSAVNEFSFEARVKNGNQLRCFSPSHPKMKVQADGLDMVLSLKEQNAFLKQDVTLGIVDDAKTGADERISFTSFGHEGSQYLMLRYRPALSPLPGTPGRGAGGEGKAGGEGSRHYVFLYEASANRDPLLARAQIDIIKSLLENVEHDDTFTLVAANTRVHKKGTQLVIDGGQAAANNEMRPLFVDATPENVQQALKWLENVQLIGALDLGQALTAVEPELRAAKNPYLVHIGAAVPGIGQRNDAELVKRIPPNAKYIGIGVGKQWNRTFMKLAADRTGGYFTQINPDEPINWRCFDLLATLNTPILTVEGSGVRGQGSEKDATPAFLLDATTIAQGEELCAVTRIGPALKLDATPEKGIQGKPNGSSINWDALSPEQKKVIEELLNPNKEEAKKDVKALDNQPQAKPANEKKIVNDIIFPPPGQAQPLNKIEQPFPQTVLIKGKLNGKDFVKEIKIDNIVHDAGYLPRQWAKLELDRLLAEDAVKNKPTIIALSKASYVMSPYTSLLVLETEADYAKYNVDRGRKDHWAMYACPDKIPVVYEPNAKNNEQPAKVECDADRILPTILVRQMATQLHSPIDDYGNAFDHIKVVPVHGADPAILQQALDAIQGRKTQSGLGGMSGGPIPHGSKGPRLPVGVQPLPELGVVILRAQNPDDMKEVEKLIELIQDYAGKNDKLAGGFGQVLPVLDASSGQIAFQEANAKLHRLKQLRSQRGASVVTDEELFAAELIVQAYKASGIGDSSIKNVPFKNADPTLVQQALDAIQGRYLAGKGGFGQPFGGSATLNIMPGAGGGFGKLKGPRLPVTAIPLPEISNIIIRANPGSNGITLMTVGNRLVIAGNDPDTIAKMSDLIRILTTTVSSPADFEILPIQHGNATQTASILDAVFNGPASGNFVGGIGGKGGGGGGAQDPLAAFLGQIGGNPGALAGVGGAAGKRVERIRVVADPATNKLLVWASPLDMLIIHDLLEKSIDPSLVGLQGLGNLGLGRISPINNPFNAYYSNPLAAGYGPNVANTKVTGKSLFGTAMISSSTPTNTRTIVLDKGGAATLANAIEKAWAKIDPNTRLDVKNIIDTSAITRPNQPASVGADWKPAEVRVYGAPALKTYSVPAGNAESTAKMLQDIYKSSPTMRIQAVGTTQIMVYAPVADQMEIARLIAMAIPQTEVTFVYPLHDSEANKIADFVLDRAGATTSAPIVKADMAKNAIIIIGSLEQVEMVKQMISGLSGEAIPGGNGYFIQPADSGKSQTTLFTPDPRLFGDLLSYAPGMNTSLADIQAVLEAEATILPPAKSGAIDPAARKLIDKARSLGWQKITIPGDASVAHASGSSGFVVYFSADGKFIFERVLASGLSERVICDGKTLWHLYPEIGVGAKRAVSRFHRAELHALAPWLVPSAADLTEGADVRLVDKDVVGVVPQGVGKGRPFVQVNLKFAADGRLAEQETVLMPAKIVLSRQRYAADGTVTMVDPGTQKTLGEMKLAVAAAEVPVAYASGSLNANVKDLVIIPMPLRTVNHLTAKLKGEMEDFDADAAISLLAAYCTGDANSVLSAKELLARRFFAKGDRRLGFYVLLASANAAVDPREPYKLQGDKGQCTFDVVADHPREPLAFYLAHQFKSLGKAAKTSDFGDIGGPPDGFLQRLATFHDLWSAWQTGKALQGLEADRDRQRLRTLEFLGKSPLPIYDWVLLTAMTRHGVGTDPRVATLLADAPKLFADDLGLSFSARYEIALGHFQSDQASQWAAGREQFRKLYFDTLEAGFLPPLDPSFREALSTAAPGERGFSALLHEAAKTLAKRGQRLDIVTLAWQAQQVGDQEIAGELLAQAVAVCEPGQERGLAQLAAVQFYRQSKQTVQADTLLHEAMAGAPFKDNAQLWRLAAELAAERKQTAKVLACVDTALNLEFQDLPATVNIQEIRQQYGSLLKQYQEMANAFALLEKPAPKDFVIKVVRAADHWRSLDPDPTDVCQLTSKILQTVGAYDLAWDYLTTPIALKPNDAAAWANMAKALAADGNLDFAERAYALAFETEPTNAQILWDRAANLVQAGRPAEARAVYQILANGQWQDRWQWLQAEAKRKLESR